MLIQRHLGFDERFGSPCKIGALTLLLFLSLSTTGCYSALAKHSAALSVATAPVVEQATAAYHNAEALHELREDYDATVQFDAPQPVYNPRNTPVLISDRDIRIRVTVLAAFQAYSRSLNEITNEKGSPALDAASKSVGENLSSVGNALAPAVASTLGVAAASSAGAATNSTATPGDAATESPSATSTPASLITPEVQNGISLAANALGQFLVSRKIKKELSQKIKEMDPHVEALCKLLADDIEILRDQEQRDYNRIINLQTLFVRQNTNLGASERRIEIMKLPEIVRRQREADQKLIDLRASIVHLELTHHALAAEAQGNNPESLKTKLGELATAGNSLGTFYSSLTEK